MQTIQKSLLIVDGMHVLRRVFEANRKDFPESMQDGEMHAAKAVDVCVTSLRRATREIPVTHAMLAMDVAGTKNWRHDIYPAYKENRSPMPEALRLAVPDFVERIENEVGIKSFGAVGFEADDLICSATKKWCAAFPAGEVPDVTIITTDKDIHVLIDERVVIRDHFSRGWRDAAFVREEFGVEPHQISDYLALIGDAVDNIPGVNGIGPKTAAKLLKEYGSIDEILSNLDSMASKPTAGKIIAGLDSLKLSAALTYLCDDVKFGRAWKDFRIAPPLQEAEKAQSYGQRPKAAIN